MRGDGSYFPADILHSVSGYGNVRTNKGSQSRNSNPTGKAQWVVVYQVSSVSYLIRHAVKGGSECKIHLEDLKPWYNPMIRKLVAIS